MRLFANLVVALCATAHRVELAGPTTTATTSTSTQVNFTMTTTKTNEITVTQTVVMSSALAANDAIEMFTCIKRGSTDYACSLTALAYDGSKHTITNSVYTKTSAPASGDFTSNSSFTSGGFTSGYTKIYSQPGAATAVGSDAAGGTATTSNAAYVWQSSGNSLSSDAKTLTSTIKYTKEQLADATALAMHAAIKTGVSATLSGVYTKVSSTELATVSSLSLGVPTTSSAVTVASTATEVTSEGPVTTPIYKTWSTLKLLADSSTLTIDSVQKAELKAALANGEVMEMFTCLKQTAIDYLCFYTKLAFDGINHTMTNASYYKQNLAPLSTDFTANKPFDNTTGFSSGFVLWWQQAGASTVKGTGEAQTAATEWNADYRWSTDGNLLSTDVKTLTATIQY